MFVDRDLNVTTRPSPLIEGSYDCAFATAPFSATLITSVRESARSRRKTPVNDGGVFTPRLVAADSKTTKRPSAEMRGKSESALACLPELDTLTRSVRCVARSYTKMSQDPFVSFATRFLA